MSHIVHEHLARGDARIVDLPVAERVPHEVDRNFGLPPTLYGATVACYLGFLAIVGTVFANPVLLIPMVIFAFTILAGFGVPTIWTRFAGNTTEPQTMGEFETRGIMTHTGRLTARDATMQVLVLPVLLVTWGIAVAVIVAIVA